MSLRKKAIEKVVCMSSMSGLKVCGGGKDSCKLKVVSLLWRMHHSCGIPGLGGQRERLLSHS